MGEHYDIGGGKERYYAEQDKKFKESLEILKPTIKLNLKAAVETASKKMASIANEKQVGGKHYKSSYQHWDLVLDFGLHYLEACATKYVTRRKNSRGEDIGKGIHYIEKLMESAGTMPAIRVPGRFDSLNTHQREHELKRYSLANNLTFREHVIMKMIVIHMDYQAALEHMKELQKEV